MKLGHHSEVPIFRFRRPSLFIFMILWVMLGGCKDHARLVVFADPWLREYATGLCAEFQAQNPEVEIKLRVLSTEVILQHLRYGQPMDIALLYGADLYKAVNQNQVFEEVRSLADARLVEVAGPSHANQTAFHTQNCTMVEASDRPSRLYAERYFGKFPRKDSCTIIANFQSQAISYLQNGWVPRGFVPLSFAKSLSPPFHILRESALITNAFSAAICSNPPNPGTASQFWKTIGSEKSAALLVKSRILP